METYNLRDCTKRILIFKHEYNFECCSILKFKRILMKQEYSCNFPFILNIWPYIFCM
jgi:hypothetical protein